MHEEVLSPQTKKFLLKITPKIFPSGFYLAGGTAVALHLGHRRSADLDFFTPTEFVEIQWEEKLKKNLGFKLLIRDWQILIGHAGEVKISLFGYPYRQIVRPETFYRVPIASLPDLAGMKLEMIIGRGTKRDFLDIYFLSQKFSLKRLLEFYQKKYGNLEERELMIKKALVFFDEADKDEMPEMLVSVNWEEIKRWFIGEVRKI